MLIFHLDFFKINLSRATVAALNLKFSLKFKQHTVYLFIIIMGVHSDPHLCRCCSPSSPSHHHSPPQFSFSTLHNTQVNTTISRLKRKPKTVNRNKLLFVCIVYKYKYEFVSVIGRMPVAKHQHHQPYSNFSHREMIKYWKTLICCQHIHLLRRTRPNPILPRNLPDLTESIFQNHRLLEYEIPGVRLIFLIHNEKSSTIWYFAFCIIVFCIIVFLAK